jgi:hypothetical protein
MNFMIIIRSPITAAHVWHLAPQTGRQPMGSRLVLESMDWKVGKTWRGYRFASPTTLVTGPVGAAKSTLCEFFCYATGTPARLMPAVVKSFSAVRVRMQVGTHHLELERSLRTSEAATVSVTDLDGHLPDQVLPVVRTAPGDTSLSDFLLNTLAIPPVALPGAHGNELTFSHVSTVLYLAQRRISTELLGVDKKVFPQSRTAALDVLLGVDNGRGEDLHRQIQDANRQLGSHSSYVANVRRFLSDGGADRTTLEQQQKHRRQQHAGLLHEADLLSKQLADAAIEDQKLLNHLERARVSQQAEELRERDLTKRANLLTEKKVRLLAEITQRESHCERPTHCSACQQVLTPLSHQEQGRCPQCRQPVTPTTVTAADLQRLQSAVTNTQRLLDQIGAQLATAQQAKSRSSAELTKAVQALQRLRETVAQPLTLALRETEKRAAQLKEAIIESDARMRQWGVIVEYETKVRDTRTLLADLKNRLREWETNTAQIRRGVASDLTAQFSQILDVIGMPGRHAAYIDPTTYSPIVGTDGFSELAVSGGRKTIVCLAFHLCLLAYGRTSPRARLPLLSIIDSPTEGIGSRGNDAALIRGIDSVLSSFEVCNDGEHRVQLIVAGNNSTVMRRSQSIIRLSSDFLLLNGVRHPAQSVT